MMIHVENAIEIRERNALLARELAATKDRLQQVSNELNDLHASTFWRASLPLRSFVNWIRTPLRRAFGGVPKLRASSTFSQLSGLDGETPTESGPRGAFEPYGALKYSSWIEACGTPTEEDILRIRAHITGFLRSPLISIIIPAEKMGPTLLRESIESIRNQFYPHWELCITYDMSIETYIHSELKNIIPIEPRIRLVIQSKDCDSYVTSNAAIKSARGEFVAFLRNGDCLGSEALYEFVYLLNCHNKVKIAYSDEDTLDLAGQRVRPYFKPDWDPEMFLGQNRPNHFAFYCRSHLEEIGGFRVDLEGSQDFDLMLRAAVHSTSEEIHHIPAVLYHCRDRSAITSPDEQLDRRSVTSRQVVRDHLASLPEGRGAIVEPNPVAPEHHRIRWPLPSVLPKISVLIPTRNSAKLLSACTNGLLNATNYPNIEVLIIDNGSYEEDALLLLANLARDRRVRIITLNQPFNYAEINNKASAEATGDMILFLNNDIEVLEEDWLQEMVSHALRPGVGTVGAKLLYPDNRIQCAGVVLGIGNFDGEPGVAAHFADGDLADSDGYFGHSVVTRCVSANTAACLLLRRETFLGVNGFDAENLAVEYNDVDLCLRISQRGLRHIWTPFARLLHHERGSRGRETKPHDVARSYRENKFMRRTWGALLDTDPFYNANFSRLRQRYDLCYPIRRIPPWRTIL